MKLIIESTTKTVDLVVNGKTVPARIWEGHTDSGIPVHCYITRVAVHQNHDTAQFAAELRECSTPGSEIQAIPLRLIL